MWWDMDKAVLNLEQYSMCCYVTLSNIIILINAYEDVYPLFSEEPVGQL